MRLTLHQLRQIILQAQRDAPNETCGLVAGAGERAHKVFSLPNDSSRPQVEYNAEPRALLEVLRAIDDEHLELLAIYHSHPASPAFPSPTDIARAFYPDAIYVIVSLQNPAQASVRGFRIEQGQVSEVSIEVEEDESSRENSRRSAQRTGRSRAGRVVAPLSRRRPARGNTRGTRR
jgi:[CysO sulfur-carrier protein]-S-L-cysteine hydrolase